MKIKCLIFFILLFTNLSYSLQMNSKLIGQSIVPDNNSIEIEEKELDKYLKSFFIKLKDNQINKDKLKEKGVSGTLLKNLIQQYLKLKETNQKFIKNSEFLNKQDFSWMMRFKTKGLKDKKLNKDDFQKFQSQISNNTNNSTSTSQIDISFQNNTSSSAINVTHNIFYSQILEEKKETKNSEKSFEDCLTVKEWGYVSHGDDWPCICKNGNFQSPINIERQKARNLVMNSKIFFDFNYNEMTSAKDVATFRVPLIRNLGTLIEIEIDCGIVILPSHMNGYKCYKIQIHTPSEHKIESNSADMEIQIYFKLKDKHIVDQTTRDYLVLVILVKGIEEENYQKYIRETVRNHPFIELLEVDKLPVSKGLARLLSNNLNFDLIFDKSKQPFKLLGSQNDKNIDEDITIPNKLLEAINDFSYDKHYPLKEYYLYNGSFTTPPCNENVTYLVIPEVILTKMQQIIDISKIILSSSASNIDGNNRNIQKLGERNVYYHKINRRFDKIIQELNLVNIQENKHKKTQEKLDLDSILNNKNTKLKEILDLKKLR